MSQHQFTKESSRSGLRRTIVYVSCAEAKEIRVLGLDLEKGDLNAIDSVSVPGTGEPSPISMPLAISPDQGFLYAALRSPPYLVSSFAIDPRSGRLTHLGSVPLPDNMAYIVTDRTGRYLFSASYHGAKLAINPIDSRGMVQAPARQLVATPPNAHCVLPDASNRYVYATSLGGDVILQLRFDAATGLMTPNEPATIATKAKAGPRHLVLHPSGRFLYLINELDATISSYAIDRVSGSLEALQTVSLLSADFPGKPSAADIHVTPDGRFLYGSERASNTLAAFAVDADSGMLALIGSVPTEAAPRGFNIDPLGRFLLAVGQTSHRLSAYAIDPRTGRLTRIGRYKMGANPNWVEIIDLPDR